MDTLIKAVEVWLPTPDGTLLEFGGGWFGAATAFGAASRAMCFGRGEGLPGRAWDEARPLVLKQFENSYFRRTAAAREAGLHFAVALPFHTGRALTAVLVFFGGGDGSQAGAMELWRNDPRVSSDMTLVDGYFGDRADAFEAISRDTFLPRGSGLPGMAWQRGAAVLIDDLGKTAKFMRADTAEEAGINRGLAFPCETPSNDAYVMALLSTTRTPIAGRLESWAPDASHHGLQRVFGFCEKDGPLRASDGGTVLAGAIGKAFASGVPVVNANVASEPECIAQAAKAAGLGALVALPVISEGAVSEVLALYF
jgi:hypothetical protein